eukprot:3035833-Alexandrium_andersonii.AAC.1
MQPGQASNQHRCAAPCGPLRHAASHAERANNTPLQMLSNCAAAIHVVRSDSGDGSPALRTCSGKQARRQPSAGATAGVTAGLAEHPKAHG